MAKRYKITECNVDDVIGSLMDYVNSLTDNEMKRKEIVGTISGIARSLEQDAQRTIPGVPGVEDPTVNLPMIDEVPQMEFNADGELEVLPNELELVHDPDNMESLSGNVDLGTEEEFEDDELSDEAAEGSVFAAEAIKELKECEGGAAMSAQGAQGGSDAEGGGVRHGQGMPDGSLEQFRQDGLGPDHRRQERLHRRRLHRFV